MQMTWMTVWMLLVVAGCGLLLTEQRMVKVDRETRTIQHDFTLLSATFTPEQQEKYARHRRLRMTPHFKSS
jgi:uncharacterized membrane protein affecting hemolysin expression